MTELKRKTVKHENLKAVLEYKNDEGGLKADDGQFCTVEYQAYQECSSREICLKTSFEPRVQDWITARLSDRTS